MDYPRNRGREPPVWNGNGDYEDWNIKLIAYVCMENTTFKRILESYDNYVSQNNDMDLTDHQLTIVYDNDTTLESGSRTACAPVLYTPVVHRRTSPVERQGDLELSRLCSLSKVEEGVQAYHRA